MKTTVNKQRRQVLVWSAPTVMAVSLPVHAGMSACSGPPLVSVPVAPKCAGDPLIGEALLEILAPDAIAMELVSVSIVTSDAANMFTNLPTLPAMLSETTPVTVTWEGPAGNATQCLPTGSISLVLEYACSDGVVVSETYDMTALLLASAA